jgi:hypothetical protein
MKLQPLIVNVAIKKGVQLLALQMLVEHLKSHVGTFGGNFLKAVKKNKRTIYKVVLSTEQIKSNDSAVIVDRLLELIGSRKTTLFKIKSTKN